MTTDRRPRGSGAAPGAATGGGKPEIYPAVCVHGQIAAASCRACVDACPHEALVLTERALGFNEGACTGCGLCRPACPVEAIRFAWTKPPLPVEGTTGTVYLACHGGGITEGPGAVPCLDALGARELTALADAGASRLALAAHDCTSCSTPRNGAFDRCLANLNARRAQAGHGEITTTTLPASAWMRHRAGSQAEVNDLDQGRRGFLGLFGLTTDRQPARRDAGRPRAQVHEQACITPQLSGSRCRGCDACVRVCRYGALRLESGDGALRYVIDPMRCTGCGVCLDVCDAGAISLRDDGPAELATIALVERLCPRCGISWHGPIEQQESQPTCSICRRKSPVGRLFQVRE